MLTFATAVTGATQGATLLSDDDLPDAVVKTTKEYITKNGFLSCQPPTAHAFSKI